MLPAKLDVPALVEFTLTVTGFEAQPADGGYRLRVGSQTGPLMRGGPDVPTVARTIPGIPGYSAHVRVLNTETEEFEGVSVAPTETYVRDDSQPDRPALKGVRIRDESVYGRDAFWPADLIAVQEASMGTQKFVRIECRPIQYNPASHTVRFNREIDAELWFEAQEKP
jgi:hypothetical protein